MAKTKEKILWSDMRKESIIIPSCALVVGIVLASVSVSDLSLSKYKEFTLFIAGILAGMFLFTIDEIFNRAPDRKEDKKRMTQMDREFNDLKSKNTQLQKQLEDVKEQNIELLDLTMEVQYAKYSTAYELGQYTFLIVKSSGKEFSTFNDKIKNLCDGLDIQNAYVKASNLLPAKDASVIFDLQNIFEDAIAKKYGHMIKDSFIAGVDICMFSNLVSTNTSLPMDFVKRFWICIQEMHTIKPIFDNTVKFFDAWENKKITSSTMFTFLNLLDHFFRFRGSLRPNVIELRSFLAKELSPYDAKFNQDSNALLGTF